MQHPKALLWSVVILVIIIGVLYYCSATGWRNPFSGKGGDATADQPMMTSADILDQLDQGQEPATSTPGTSRSQKILDGTSSSQQTGVSNESKPGSSKSILDNL